jgi:hypothetical protein
MVAPVNKTNDKFTQFLATSSLQNSGDYDIDLGVKKINANNAHGDAFSILGCEREGIVYTSDVVERQPVFVNVKSA